jgi:hypothetical protein
VGKRHTKNNTKKQQWNNCYTRSPILHSVKYGLRPATTPPSEFARFAVYRPTKRRVPN